MSAFEFGGFDCFEIKSKTGKNSVRVDTAVSASARASHQKPPIPTTGGAS